MPMALVIDKLAEILKCDVVTGVGDDDEGLLRLSEPGSLIDEAKAGAGLTDDEAAYLHDMPPALLEGMRAAIVEAIKTDKAIHLQYSPAYDFQVRLWDYGDAVSIHVSGPYPPNHQRPGWPSASS